MTDYAPAATAAYNAPDRPEDLEAQFASLADAQEYADAYGGSIEHRGVVFCVRDADHKSARDDLAKVRALAAAQAVSNAGGTPVGPTAVEFDVAVAAAVARALAAQAPATVDQTDAA